MSEQKRKVALFVGSDITAHLVLNQVVPEFLRSGFEPVIFLPKHIAGERAQLPELKQAAFLERRLNNEVVYPFIDKIPFNGDDKNLSPSGLGRKYKLDVKFVDDVNAPDFVSAIKEDESIVGGLSIRCFQIFKPDLIETLRSREFFLNLHPGVLPTYRGVMSTVWAMATGASKYGWTLHEVDKGIDTGHILWISAKKFEQPKTGLFANVDIADIGADSIRDALKKMSTGQVLAGYPQIQDSAKYYTYPTPDELEDWKAQGIVLADPKETTNILVEKFSDVNTPHGRALKKKIEEAIRGYTPPANNKTKGEDFRLARGASREAPTQRAFGT